MDRYNRHARDEGARHALKRSSAGPVVMLVLASSVLVLTLFSFPDRSNLAVHAYLVLIGLLSLWTVAGVVSQAFPSVGHTAIERALRRRRVVPETLRDIQQIELDISLSRFSAFDYYFRLRRLLRQLAGQRLAAKANIHLDADPAAARTVLGEQLWAAVTEDSREGDRDAPGVRLEDLERLVSELESI